MHLGSALKPIEFANSTKDMIVIEIKTMHTKGGAFLINALISPFVVSKIRLRLLVLAITTSNIPMPGTISTAKKK